MANSDMRRAEIRLYEVPSWVEVEYVLPNGTIQCLEGEEFSLSMVMRILSSFGCSGEIRVCEHGGE